MDRVLLLNLPFSATQSPSIGLGLLKAALARKGIACDTRYLNLWFAERLHRVLTDVDEPYALLRRRFSLLGEWVFREAAFGPDASEDPASLEKFLRQYSQYQPRRTGAPDIDLTAFSDVVLRAKREAEPFLDECMEAIEWQAVGIVGFSLVFNQNLASLALAKRVKARYPDKIVVLGGAACEEKMGESLHRLFPFVDIVCSGEGDLIFPELVSRLFAGRSIEDIPNIIYRRDGRSCSNVGKPCPKADLDALPHPDYDDYFDDLRQTQGSSRQRPWLAFETSRGCWWGEKSHCTFCSLNGTAMGYRSKSGLRALEEITELFLRYGIRQMDAADNIMPLHYFADLFPELARRRLHLQLGFETKANLTKDQLRLLRDAGVYKISPGIESLSTGVLRTLRKGCTRLQNVQLLKWAQELGIWLEWNMLIGVPGEDPAEYPGMAEVIRAIPHLPPPWGCTFIRLDRFSPYFVAPEEFGISNVQPLDVYRYVYPLDQNDIADLAYYFRYDFTDGRDTRAYTQCVVDAVEDWKTYEGASLSYRLDGGAITILDERPGFPRQEIVLSGTEKEIFLFCDQMRSLRAILKLVESTVDAGRCSVKAFLEQMLDLKFMLREGDTYLSLPTQMPNA